MARSGDRCERCGCSGRLHVANGRPRGKFWVQYLCCSACGNRPSNNKVIQLAESVRRRAIRD